MDAGIAALSGDQTWLEERNAIYQERRDIVVQGLRDAGLPLTFPKLPFTSGAASHGFTDSMDFCNRLLEETGVSTTPGKVYGGKWRRLPENLARNRTGKMREAMRRIVEWMKRK